jgi:hypothetical protein
MKDKVADLIREAQKHEKYIDEAWIDLAAGSILQLVEEEDE